MVIYPAKRGTAGKRVHEAIRWLDCTRPAGCVTCGYNQPKNSSRSLKRRYKLIAAPNAISVVPPLRNRPRTARQKVQRCMR